MENYAKYTASDNQNTIKKLYETVSYIYNYNSRAKYKVNKCKWRLKIFSEIPIVYN